ncbi:uncharacterized protein LOC101156394 [Oryzias latipes]|uniref:uncharacterized protein LOC101156394 n=1 Tax=Oryzias latipes TaxID=8090 RepID=UPI0002A4823F|nr:uncharacterized protein LOC101156394 [Oryzias latipes]
MKLFLFLLVSCLALIHAKGTPTTAVYKFVRCNPNGDQANCVVQQTPKMPWSPELPSKLPASTAQHLEAEPVEGESPPNEDEDDYETEVEEEETPMESEDGESPSVGEESFGSLEGSADGATPVEIDMGSGDSGIETAERKDGEMSKMKTLFSSMKAMKPTKKDLEEDHLLKM